MAEDSGEKTEQATDARREEFRKRGQVAHTKELGSGIILLCSAMGVYFMGRYFFINLFDLFNFTMGPDLVATVRSGQYTEVLAYTGKKMALLTLPVVGLAVVLGVASSIVQVGFLQVEDALSPNWDKLNPWEGLKRIVSLRGMVEFLKNMLKLVGVGIVLYFLLRGEASKIPFIMTYSVEQILFYLGKVIFNLFFALGLITIGLAAADYFFQRWDLEKKMMMTKQEVKEEVKQREGDPLIRQRIKRTQRDLANKRMMDSVKKADVIVTNPTHIAVALRYGEGLPAPQLIAKGADLIAEKIKALAREHNIPIVENKPLARTIFKTMKLGQVIPRELFVAVAEVLSYVYKLKKKKVGKK